MFNCPNKNLRDAKKILGSQICIRNVINFFKAIDNDQDMNDTK